ncbi:S8 family peptidase [Paraburkholderia sp. BCC1886]|uniref:S8 family peptidase n=1 Tax=Paraburkholderia sp. BCC1886 TaxID=2562670 RepID=UPI0011830BDC|nr:S8 family peptidase [Paraburkholderia sp. BCC1886]
MATDSRPVLNPVLTLKADPRPRSVIGGGLNDSHIRHERLAHQRERLAGQLRDIANGSYTLNAGLLLIVVDMFEDSLATTYTPSVIFNDRHGSQLIAPVPNGYLVQIRQDACDDLAAYIESSTRAEARAIISRIAGLQTMFTSPLAGGQDFDALWNAAMVRGNNGRVFTAWLAPFFDGAARTSVTAAVNAMHADGRIHSLPNLIAITREPGSDTDQLQVQQGATSSSVARGTRAYRQVPFTQIEFVVDNVGVLRELVAAGAVFRIDPVRPVKAAVVPRAPDPDRPIPDEQWQPIVGVVDGGLFAQSYEAMVAWRAPSLVSDVAANRKHGNQITSLVVQGSAWNPHLSIPDLVCRVGVAQSIAREDSAGATSVELETYLRSVIGRHCGDTKVWNMSFSEPVDGHRPLFMSRLGHQLNKIARTFGVLPVIAIGNCSAENSARLCPPADCESALTVAGRQADAIGEPANACEISLPGPGPEGLFKPEVSWFSSLRGLGGELLTGSSYATAITSALAAHTFHNLKAPTPDLVRALLINATEREAFDNKLGWGTPHQNQRLPWVCAEGSVTLAWTASLAAGFWHYWDDIPIPPEFIHDGKLRGRVALTSILHPLVSELGMANYFATRVQVALQYWKLNGRIGNLAGSMREDLTAETEARASLGKWNPVRHHVKNIVRGRAFSGTSLRVGARIFPRDLYQFGYKRNEDVPPSEVAFVLRLDAPADSPRGASIYNSVVAQLGNYVESAVNDVDIHVEQ